MIPTSDFTIIFQQNICTTTALYALACCGAIALGIAIANRVKAYVSRLNSANQERAEGGLGQSLHQVEENATPQNMPYSQQLAAAVPGMIYTYTRHPDGSHRFEYVSSVSQDILELEPAQVMADADSILALIHPGDRPTYEATIARSATALEPFSMVFRIRTPSDLLKWVEANARPVQHGAGSITWYGILMDVSERVQREAEREHAEQALLEKEIQFHELASVSPSIIYIVAEALNGPTRFEFLSPAFEDVHEISIAEAYRDASIVFNQIHPDDRQSYLEAVAHSLSNQQPFQHEWRIITPSGQIKWLQASSRHSHRANGEIAWYGVVTEVTDRKWLELALQASEAKLSDVLNGARLFSIVSFRVFSDQTWEYEYQSPGCEVIFGYTAQEICADRNLWMAQVFSADREAIIYPLFDDIFNDRSKTVEFRFHHKDGSLRWISATYSSRHDELRNCWCVTGVSTDITARKQAEDALRESEERLRLALESAYIGNWDWNIETNQICWSESLERLMGLQPGTFDGRFETFSRLIHADDQPRVLDAITRSVVQGQEYDIEFRFIKPDGSIRWVSSRGSILYDQLGKPVRMTGVDIDITERKQMELSLRQSEQKFRGAFDTITTGMALMSLAGGFQEVNSTLCQMLGYSEEELLALRLEDVMHPLDQRNDLSYIERMMANEIPGYQVEKRFLHKDRHEIWGLFNIALMRDRDDRLLYFIVQITDISDRKQAEQELEQAKETAEAANQAKSIFLANMSHELRTPLNAILGFSQLMQYSTDIPEDYREYLHLIHKSGNYLLKLINEVLDLSKIEAGKLTVEQQITDLYKQLGSIRHTFSERFSRKNLLFHLDICADVPQYIKIDAQKLEQVLLNLLSNAIKFTSAGHVTLRVSRADGDIERRTEDPSPTLRFEVEDTGVGIAPQDVDLIFDAFAQASSGQHVRDGTGLGLTISRRLVQLLGGELSVQSVLGQGSTFQFTVPVEVVTEAFVQSAQGDRHVIGIAPNQASYRILVVDDQAENRLLLVKLLEHVGLSVRAATTGEEALSIWEEWHPHLIWMDIRLPGIDGYEVTCRIRASDPEHRANTKRNDSEQSLVHLSEFPIIIALTAQALPEDCDRALAAGCTDYMSKPFQRDALFSKMTEHLGIEFLYAENEQVLDEHPLVNEDFAIMPQNWITALHEAAILCQEEAVELLLQQVPPEHASFAHKIARLAHDFEFQQIMDLTKSYLHTDLTK